MGLFTWLTGQPEPQPNQATPEVNEEYEAKINTPYEYRNCMNCKRLHESGGTFYCELNHGYLNTEDRNKIAEQNCQTHAWEPRKLGGSYNNFVFDPYNWYEEY